VEQKAVRTAVGKVFKARGAKLRKGSWRLPGEGLTWFVSLRATGPQRDAALVLEVGCWVHDLVPEPEGGPVDCPLLLDQPLDPAGDVVAVSEALLDRLEAVPTVAELASSWRAGEWQGAYVDAVLTEHLASR